MTVFSNGVCGAFISARKLSTYQSYEVQKKPVIPAQAGIQKTSVLHPDRNRYIYKGCILPPDLDGLARFAQFTSPKTNHS